MPMTHVSVQDAHARQHAGEALVDVRSTREFAAGHPAGAINVPLMEHDEDNGQLLQNPDFVRVMTSLFPNTTSIMLTCQSGNRSVRAAQMLETFGYANLTNVLGGFAGARDGSAPGWQPAGLPVETTATPGTSYASLLEKADKA